MASGNMKDIKRRMKSVQSTMQITKAMELVASSKLRHAKERVLRSRPYFNTMYETMARIARETRDGDSIYTKARTVKKSLFIVIAGDRGLAGGYNSNVLKLAAAQMAGKTPCVVTIGKKSQEYYAKRNFEVLADFPGIAETMQIQDTHDIVDDMLARFRDGSIDEAYICYTEFVSPMVQEARCQKLLPLSFPGSDDSAGKGKPQALTEYDPSPEAVFSAIVPEYLNGVLYGAVVESYASEQSARRMAMESASDNASEMIENLNLSYNRARQAAITQEITEIVAGSGQVGA
jgi:F-type H+-transporting ATPase subunit gamma